MIYSNSTCRSPRCLVPGAGLARLACEISRLGTDSYGVSKTGQLAPVCECMTDKECFVPGFESQGNEFSYYMLICSSFLLNQYVTVPHPWWGNCFYAKFLLLLRNCDARFQLCLKCQVKDD